MDDYVRTSRDNGGVHINSGIPNHAFYLAATALGGNAWERAGQIWYDTLTGGQLAPDADFADFAAATAATALGRYGDGEEQRAVPPRGKASGSPDPDARCPAGGHPTWTHADIGDPLRRVRRTDRRAVGDRRAGGRRAAARVGPRGARHRPRRRRAWSRTASAIGSPSATTPCTAPTRT